MRDDVALSFDNMEGQPYLRRPASQMQQQQGRAVPSSSTSNNNGQGMALPFMTFDLPSNSGSNKPLPYGGGAYNGGGGGSYGGGGGGFASFEDEPPLLEELGINVTQITQRMLSILNPFKMNTSLHEDPDLSGPFMFCMLFGLCQLLSGKVHFGVILGWTSVASMFLYMVYNLLAGSNGNLDLYRSVSLVGYSLVPLVLFSLVSVFIPGRSIFRFIMAAISVLWSTRACTTLMVALLPHADELRSLIAFPCALIYMAFSLLVLF